MSTFLHTEIFYNDKVLGTVTHYDGKNYTLLLKTGFEVIVPWIFLAECTDHKPEKLKNPFFGPKELDF